MTNPDREELVKHATMLADWIDGNDIAIIHCHPEGLGALDASQEQRDLIATALRRLASSEDTVKVRKLEWMECSVLGGRHKLVAFDCFGHEYRRIDLPAEDIKQRKADAQKSYEARIRSALVEVPAVKGEPEPVAWLAEWVEGGAPVLQAYTSLEAADRAARNVRSYRTGFPVPTITPVYTAPPADAGMREACMRILPYLRWTISDESPGHHPTMPSAVAEFEAALTAPGATTKSDGVPDRESWWLIERIGTGQYTKSPDALPALTDDPWRAFRFATEREAHEARLRLVSLRDECKVTEHIFINKYDHPSDPSPTRSDVTVEELADWLFANLRSDTEPHQDASALLDQFEIRRK